MSQKPGLLPKLEILIIGILLLVFMMWAVSKCSATKRRYQEKAAFEASEQARVDSLEQLAQQADIKLLDTMVKPINEAPEQERVRVTPLFVTIDGFNMRSGPGLNYKILDRLQLHEEVAFMGEVTDTTQEINLGQIITDEPWVKVKNHKGQIGWVYGAGVSYYKKELQGVDTE